MRERSYRQLIGDPGFSWMLVTQFLGALNDNVYKFVITFFAIGLAAENPMGWAASTHISVIGGVFILPFLLFSGYAGQLADNYSKRSVLIVVKSLEILAMGLALVAFLAESLPLMLIVLFLMATQSTLFSPAKYGSLPELLPERDLSRGNALIEMSTFVAIILGAVIGGVAFAGLNDQPLLLGLLVLGLACVGTAASFGIGRTPVPKARRGFSLNPAGDVWLALGELRGDRRLWLTVLGISWFWFLGALLQLVVPLYATAELGLSAAGAGWLQASIAIGIGAGSLAAGRLSGPRVELGLVPLGSIGIGVTALFLVGAETVWGSLICFSLLGVFGGLYAVPLNALLQQKSATDKRGRVIAANNVMNTLAILGASAVNFAFGSLLDLRPGTILFISGLMTFAVTLYLFILLPDFLIRFSLWLLTHSVYRIKIVGAENVPLNGPALLVCNHLSFVDGLLVGACVQRFVRFMAYAPFFAIPGLGWLFRKMHAIPTGGTRALEAIRRARAELEGGHVVCIFAEGAISRTGNLLPFKRGFERIIEGLDVPIVPVHLDQLWGSIFSFKDGRFFWKWPQRWFYPVTITFGAPLNPGARAWDLRQKLLEMGGEAFRHRRRPQDFVSARFIRTAKRRWSSLALADSTGRELNFGRALTGATLLARRFRRRLADERMVGILLPASVAGALVNMGLMLAGKVPVNLNFTIGPKAMDEAIRQCRISTIVTARAFLAKAKIAERPDMIFVEDLLAEEGKVSRLLAYLAMLMTPAGLLVRQFAPREKSVEDLCTVMFSSGSTGAPKGVMLSEHNILSNLEAIGQILWARRGDCVLGVLPFFHSFGFTGTLCMPLVLGLGAVYHPNPLDAKTIGQLTFAQAYHRVCAPEDFASLRHVIVGAERLRPDLAQAFKEKFNLDMLEGYGCTEMGPVVAVNVPNISAAGEAQTGHKPGTVGHPVPGVAAKVVHPETHAELAEGAEGLLLLKGPGRMVGYLDDPGRTADALKDEWYITGDIATIDEDGFIRITDRLSRFSKIGGEMVPHVKIEEAMLRIPGLDGACVTAIPDEKRGERLVGFFVADESMGAELVWAGLNETELPKIWLPKASDLHRLDELPVLGTGKVDLKRLKTMALTFAAAPG
jgi:acyl-[acyl-carrier-protein]-phospholipid O-acyltransferase / long-chain-fatty-acid--[acyl-carrier-protein] ligase